MPLNKADAFQLLTCANAFHHSNKQHNNREWLLSASQWKTDFRELKPANEPQTDRWTEIKQNSQTHPCWMHHWGTTGGCPAWNEEAQLKRSRKAVPSPQNCRDDSTKRQTAGQLGEACTTCVAFIPKTSTTQVYNLTVSHKQIPQFAWKKQWNNTMVIIDI